MSAIAVNLDLGNFSPTAGLSRTTDIDTPKDFALAANGRIEPKPPNAAPHSNGGITQHSGRWVSARCAYS